MIVDVVAPADETVRHGFAALEADLVEEFCPPLDPNDVRRRCAEAVASLESAPAHSYLVVLVEHDLRQQLRRIRDRRNRLSTTQGGSP